MGLFSKLTSAVLQTAILPIEMAKDSVTLFGAMTDQPEAYTLQRLRRINHTIEDVIDELDE